MASDHVLPERVQRCVVAVIVATRPGGLARAILLEAVSDFLVLAFSALPELGGVMAGQFSGAYVDNFLDIVHCGRRHHAAVRELISSVEAAVASRCGDFRPGVSCRWFRSHLQRGAVMGRSFSCCRACRSRARPIICIVGAGHYQSRRLRRLAKTGIDMFAQA